MATYDTSFIDPTRPDVTIKIGGEVRSLTFDYQAICKVEKLTGVNMLQDSVDADFSLLGSMLYAALLPMHNGPENPLTLDEVGSWINFKNAPIVYQAVMDAWHGSLPKAKADTGEATAQAAPSPGAA